MRFISVFEIDFSLSLVELFLLAWQKFFVEIEQIIKYLEKEEEEKKLYQSYMTK
jgi:hypothetical protein